MAVYLELKELEDRLSQLEEQIGKQSASDDSAKELVNQVYEMKQKLANATSGRETIHKFWKRLDELNSCLDPQLTDKLTLPDDVKANVLLAEKEHIAEQALLLEEVEKLKSVFDSEHIKAAPDFSEKLHPLALVQLDQQEKLNHLSEDVKQLLEAYNNIITLVSKQFVQWDEILTKYEISKQVRKTNEFI